MKKITKGDYKYQSRDSILQYIKYQSRESQNVQNVRPKPNL